MEYADKVFKQIKQQKPGSILNLANLKNRELYVSTVKQLVADRYLSASDIEFTDDYMYLKIIDYSILEFKKLINKQERSKQ